MHLPNFNIPSLWASAMKFSASSNSMLQGSATWTFTTAFHAESKADHTSLQKLRSIHLLIHQIKMVLVEGQTHASFNHKTKTADVTMNYFQTTPNCASTTKRAENSKLKPSGCCVQKKIPENETWFGQENHTQFISVFM